MTTKCEKYDDSGAAGATRVCRRARVPEHRAELVRRSARARAGDVVLDLACGDGGLGGPSRGPALHRRRRRAGRWSMRRAGSAARRRARRSQRLRAGRARAATTIFRAIYYARDRGVLRADRGLHGEEARLRPQPAPVRARDVVRGPAPPASTDRHSARSSSRSPCASAAVAAALRGARARGPARPPAPPPPLHLPRRRLAPRTAGRMDYSGWKPNATWTPSRRRSLLLGSSSAGTNVSEVTSTRHGPRGAGSRIVWAWSLVWPARGPDAGQ